MENGIDFTVINFNSDEECMIDGVKIVSLNYYNDNCNSDYFDMLISHAPNLRNHYRFIKKYEKRFLHILFFFHGHEVLKTLGVYPKL